MNRPELSRIIDAYRAQSYGGPTPAWPAPRRRLARTPLLLASAAVLALMVLPLLTPQSRFGAAFTPRPSAYSALKQVRQALPPDARPQSGTLTLTRLPPRPARGSGFAAEPTDASIRRVQTAPIG